MFPSSHLNQECLIGLYRPISGSSRYDAHSALTAGIHNGTQFLGKVRELWKPVDQDIVSSGKKALSIFTSQRKGHGSGRHS